MPSILVTGVSSGIGRATALRFVEAGWSVQGTVRDLAREAAAPAGGVPLPASIVLRTLDLADRDSIQACARTVIEESGAPDAVLNNAGTLHFGAVEDTDQETMEQVFQVNVFGQIDLIKHFLPAMRERGSGTIANVSSLGGQFTFPFFATYNASKHAIEGFSEGLWHELRPFGLKVKIIEPGFVATPIWEKASVTPDQAASASPPYQRGQRAMAKFESTISSRTSPMRAADQIYQAVTDPSERLRYPVAAYARTILAAQRLLGEEQVRRTLHNRFLGGS